MNIHNVKKLVNIITDMKIDNNSMSDMCKDCVQDKQTWNILYIQENWAITLIDLLYVNLISSILLIRYNEH